MIIECHIVCLRLVQVLLNVFHAFQMSAYLLYACILVSVMLDARVLDVHLHVYLLDVCILFRCVYYGWMSVHLSGVCIPVGFMYTSRHLYTCQMSAYFSDASVLVGCLYTCWMHLLPQVVLLVSGNNLLVWAQVWAQVGDPNI